MCKQHALRIAWTIARSIAFLDFRVLRWKFTYDWKCVNTTYRVPLFCPLPASRKGLRLTLRSALFGEGGRDWRAWLLIIKYKSKQCGPRTDCSYRSSLIWVHTVCHRGFLNISADERKADDFCCDWRMKGYYIWEVCTLVCCQIWISYLMWNIRRFMVILKAFFVIKSTKIFIRL